MLCGSICGTQSWRDFVTFGKEKQDYLGTILSISDKRVITIDGKTLQKSFDKASGQSAIHMVSAFASAIT